MLDTYICGACSGEFAFAEETSEEELNCFSKETSGGSPYANLEEFSDVAKKYDRAAVELILYLLDEMGYMEHSGSVACSQWLTEEGKRLREWARDPNWVND